MTLSDLIAGYAAVVSTLLAFFQLRKWRHEERHLQAEVSIFYSDGEAFIEAGISNIGAQPVKLLRVMYGTFHPSRLPWKLPQADSLVGVAEIIDFGQEITDPEAEVRFGEQLEGRILQPGDHVIGGIDFERAQMLFLSKWDLAEHGLRRCIWIEHSRSSRPVVVRFRIPHELQVKNVNLIPRGKRQERQAQKEGVIDRRSE